MVDMLREQVMKPSDASCGTLSEPRGETFMENYSIFLNLKTDIQFNSLGIAVLDSIAAAKMQKSICIQTYNGPRILFRINSKI